MLSPTAPAAPQPNAFGVDRPHTMGTASVDCKLFYLDATGGGMPFIANKDCYLEKVVANGTIYQVPFDAKVPTDTTTTTTTTTTV
jgi:hypothetical protein